VNCKCSQEFFNKGKVLIETLVSEVTKSGLEAVESKYYDFPTGGTTAVVLLAESHLTVHTWPERDNSIQIDISVCNYSRDNSDRALDLQNRLISVFNPEKVIAEGISGRERVTENRLPGYGYFVEITELIADVQSPYQHIQLFNNGGLGRVLVLDGLFQTSEKDEYYYHEPLAHMPLLSHPSPRDVLIVGGGDGGIAKEVLKHPSVESCTLVEIDETVINLAKEHLPLIHQGVFNNPKLNVVVEDGYKYVQECEQSYDVILLDLTDPVSCCKPLYSATFYDNVNRCLREGGFVSLHMGFPLSEPEVSRGIYEGVASKFAYAIPYLQYVPLYGTVMAFCMCSNDPPEINSEIFKERMDARRLTDLKLINDRYLAAITALPTDLEKLFRKPGGL
jgi:spermidine synthase